MTEVEFRSCVVWPREKILMWRWRFTSPIMDRFWSYAIGIRQEARGYRQPLLSYERVMKGDQIILDRPDEQDQRDSLRLTQTHLEQISANAEFSCETTGRKSGASHGSLDSLSSDLGRTTSGML